MLPFAVIDNASGKAVGMTTYMNIDAPQRRVEIGSTWYRRSVQRTEINSQCKLMLLAHAFEALNCIAVEFRTHFFNHQTHHRGQTHALARAADTDIQGDVIMTTETLAHPRIVSREQWLAARTELLVQEKEFGRQREALSAERRKLPMVRIEPMPDASLPDMRARSRPGTAIAAMMPMMATTINNSISVKPLSLRVFMTSLLSLWVNELT